MKVEFSALPKAFTGNLAAFVGADKQLLASAKALDDGSGGAVARAMSASRFTGSKAKTLPVLGLPSVSRLLLLGIGTVRALDARTAEHLGALVVKDGNEAGQKSVSIIIDPVKGSRLSAAQIAAHVALGAQLRSYRFGKYKTKEKPE